jgi:hypothetical protein
MSAAILKTLASKLKKGQQALNSHDFSFLVSRSRFLILLRARLNGDKFVMAL